MNQTQAKHTHTAGPWQIGSENHHCILAPSKTGLCIVAYLTCEGTQVDDTEANAQFIVRACNCHDELLEACKAAEREIRDQMEGCVSEGCNDTSPCSYCQSASSVIDALQAAIQKAEGQA